MADIRGEERPFETNQKRLLETGGNVSQAPGGTPTGSGAATEGSGASFGSDAPSLDSGADQLSSVETGAPFTGGVYDSSAGSVLGGFESGARGLAGGVENRLRGAEQVFRTGAGPSRTFASSGAEDALSSAIDPTSTQSERDSAASAARSFLGPEYGGQATYGSRPTGLDRGAVVGLENDIRKIRDQTDALGGRGSLTDLIEGNIPGLTPGQSAFEARNVRSQPGYRARAREIAKIPSTLSREVSSAEDEAQAFAQQRRREEDDIAGSSESYLRGEEAQVIDPLEAEARMLNRKDDRIRAAYDLLKESGSVEPLAPYMDSVVTRNEEGIQDTSPWSEGEPAPGGDPLRFFDSPLVERQEASEAARQAIDDEFSDIAHIAEPTMYVNHRGRSQYGIPTDDGVVDVRNLAPMERDRVLERQKELERAFSGRSNIEDIWTGKHIVGKGGVAAARGPHESGRKFEYPSIDQEVFDQTQWSGHEGEPIGEHRYMDSLYFSAPLKPGNIADPDGFDERWQFRPGTGASIQNLASEDDRTKVNAIRGLLNEVDFLIESEQPFGAATVAVSLDRFFEQEEQRFKTHGKEVDAREKDYWDAVKSARKKYRKLKRAKAWGQVVHILKFIDWSPWKPDTHGPKTGRDELKERAAEIKPETGKED